MISSGPVRRSTSPEALANDDGEGGLTSSMRTGYREVIEAFKLSEEDKTMGKSRTALVIGLMVALGVVLAGAGAIIYAQRQQNVNLLKGWASAVDQQNRRGPVVVKTTSSRGVQCPLGGLSTERCDA
jgi:hypothetical protein